MRVASLLPAATEIVAALGAEASLVAISHECDYPPEVTRLPRVTATPIDPGQPSAAVDAEVRRLRIAGRPVIALDADRLRCLAPELVITQGLCEVCAAADGEVVRLAAALDPPPRVLSLQASDLDGIWRDIRAIGAALERDGEAENLVLSLESRLRRLSTRLHSRVSQPIPVPRVVSIEWLDPPYVAGHWVPELVRAAGGEDVGAEAGQPSRQLGWAEIAALRPNLLIVMLCGFGVERSLREMRDLADSQARVLTATIPTWILDGNAFTSRPGPRVVKGAELIQKAMLGIEAEGLVRWPG